MFDFFPQIRLQNSWQVILNPPQINLNSIFAFYMKFQEEINKRRTFGIISHPDAGKTTLTEKLLLFGGAIQTAGAVKNNKIKKSATSDFMEIEKQRGISVATSVMAFNYKEKQINILVSTTVIEVGVNVPNASVMVIENAERFGLSQLHQLRGRVGRGEYDSYCILMTKGILSADAQTRIKAMVSTNDGFKISEIDLKLRGPGDLLGTKQSGVIDFKLADLTDDVKIFDLAKKEVKRIIEIDPKLKLNNNILIKEELLEFHHNKSWSNIG